MSYTQFVRNCALGRISLLITASAILFISVLVLPACQKSTKTPETKTTPMKLTERQVEKLRSERIFFGHQSVGDNILDGIRDLEASDPRLKLNIVHTDDPASITGPAFIEYYVGANKDPRSKNASFSTIVDRGFGASGGTALFKYCYVDIDSSSNVSQLFSEYQSEIETVRNKYPNLQIVHVTVPLTTVEPAAKAWVKSILGRTTERDSAAKREDFNRKLRQTFEKRDRIFDLAEVESTRADGTRTYFNSRNEKVYTLAPEYTTDGGHLNAIGRRRAAERLLSVLAE